MDKGKTRREISNHIERIKEFLNRREQINEDNTKIRFIIPLFQSLGWDPRSNDIQLEFNVKGVGRVDIVLKVDGKPKILVEAKPLHTELTDRESKQAVGYIMRSASPARWAMLTNGKDICLFDTKHRQKHGRLFFSITLENFEKYFEVLWLISRDRIYMLDSVADDYLKRLRALQDYIYKNRNEITRFVSLMLKKDVVKLELLLESIKYIKQKRITKENIICSKWSFEELKDYMDFLKQRYPKSYAYFKILVNEKESIKKPDLTKKISNEIGEPQLKPKALSGIRAGICAKTIKAGKERLDQESADGRMLSINNKYKDLIKKYFKL